MSILKKMRKKYYSINKHQWGDIVDKKEREEAIKLWNELYKHVKLKYPANDTERN